MNINFQNNISQDQAFDWEKIIIESFKDITITKTITIKKDANIKYIALVENSKIDIDVICEENSNCELKSIHISNDWEKIGCKINAHLSQNEAKSNLYMLSLIGEGWDIDVDWGVIIRPWVSKVSGHLLEENVVLWKKVKIKTIPKLDVLSSDVSASHWARIDRINENNLFYMMSKWLSKSTSTKLIISSYIANIFEWVENDHIEKLKTSLLEKASKHISE